ncbi:Putative cobalamin synthesis protein [Mycobacteroides abscessus subsp. massiliense]|nr:Putative cobalamin synthesis protein [Mycobacteroides abscessus subsp. massiliense]
MRIGVVVNDFGAINIDAMLVAGQVDSTMTMSNGCLCCAADDDELGGMLTTLAGRDIDAIVIEASGLAEPLPLVRMVLAAAADDHRIGYGGLRHCSIRGCRGPAPGDRSAPVAGGSGGPQQD